MRIPDRNQKLCYNKECLKHNIVPFIIEENVTNKRREKSRI